MIDIKRTNKGNTMRKTDIYLIELLVVAPQKEKKENG